LQVPPPDNVAEIYDILFYETEWYRPVIEHHPRKRRAFGINTNIYKRGPLPPAEMRYFCFCQPCSSCFCRLLDECHFTRYDYVVVGHFLPWKRSWSILQKSGRRLAIGEVYDHIEASLQMVAHFAQEGVTVSAMVPAHELADIYRSLMQLMSNMSNSMFRFTIVLQGCWNCAFSNV
jgi:hypothetical protein